MDSTLYFEFIVTDNGNIAIRGSETMNAEIKKRIGSKGTISIHFYDEKDKKSLIGHIKFKIVPEFRKAFFENGTIYNEESTLMKMWEMSEVTNSYEHYDLYKLEREQILLFISDIKRIAAEYLHTYID